MFGFNRLFSELLNIKVTQAKTEIEETPEPEEIKNSKPNNTFNDGWVNIKLSNVLKEEGIDVIEQTIRKDTDWLTTITQEDLTHIRKYKASELINTLIINRFTDDEDVNYLTKKRSITVSSIYYGFPIPDKLYLMNTETLLLLLKYTYLCETLKINLDKCKSLEPSNVLIRDINFYIKELMRNPAFKNTMDDLLLNGYGGLPNVYSLYSTVMLNTHQESVIKKLDCSQFRKIVTCIFLECGLALPRTYIHLDSDVINWVTKQAGYDTKEIPSNVVQLR